MPIPVVTVELYRPGIGWADVSAAVSLESSIEMTEAIEAPSETNAFVAPEVTLKIVEDGSGVFTFSMFSALLPESTDYLVRIRRDGVTLFHGFVLPNTVQFDDRERWCSFTAVGMAGLLARTAADSLATLKRSVDPSWRASETGGNQFFGTVVIYSTFGARYSCEILSGDTVTIETPGGQKDNLLVQSVTPTTDTAPYLSFELAVSGLRQQYEPGSTVTLATPFVRNVSVKQLIDWMLLGSSLNPTTGATFLAAPLTNASSPFATPVGQLGLTGTPLGLATHFTPILSSDPPGAFPIVGTTGAVFAQQNPPTGEWSYYAHPDRALRPLDWRPFGSGKWLMYGPRYRREWNRSGQDVVGAVYNFYAYDYYETNEPTTKLRYKLRIAVNNWEGALPSYSWDTTLWVESSSDGYTWWTVSGPHGAKSGATSTNLHNEIPLTCGIEITKQLGFKRLIFTEPDDTVDPCRYYVSMMTAAGTVTRNILSNVRGNLFQHRNGYVAAFQRDTGRGEIPVVRTIAFSGTDLVVLNESPIPADIRPFTLKRNAGDSFWYALSASQEDGVRLLSFQGDTLALRPGWVPPQLLPPTDYIGATVDLTVINGTTGTWPMMAIFGNQLWWISRSASGWIAYADVEGLSCGEAVAQLATLADAYPYVDRDLLSWVKSRSTPSPRSIITGTAATSTRLDDGGCLSFRRASVWYKSYRHVTVTNERDETITGEAGNAAFRETEQGLEVSNRFVSTSSFAVALAQHLLGYLGRALAVVDLEHEMDERRLEIGRTFTASVLGVVKNFQIIEAVARPVAGTVRVQGIEL